MVRERVREGRDTEGNVALRWIASQLPNYRDGMSIRQMEKLVYAAADNQARGIEEAYRDSRKR